jgi:hypothetical protein
MKHISPTFSRKSQYPRLVCESMDFVFLCMLSFNSLCVCVWVGGGGAETVNRPFVLTHQFCIKPIAN